MEQDHWQTILGFKDPQVMSLGLELEKHAAQRPDHPAIHYEDRTITYNCFNRMANRYANYFLDLGFKKGDIVALMMENRPEYLAITAGLSKLGVVTSLINIIIRGDVLAEGINLCEARAIIVGHEMISVYEPVKEIIRLREPALILVETEEQDMILPDGFDNLNLLLTDISMENPPTTSTVTSEDVLAVIYTSGTSGSRKAVPILQRRWLSNGHQVMLFGYMTQESIQYMSLPLYLSGGFNVCFSGMMISGSTMVMKREFSASRFWQDVQRYKIDYFVSVGEMARYLYHREEQPDDTDNTLKTMICNGIWGGLLEPFKQRFGLQHIIEIYGSAEGVGSYFNYEEIPGMCGNLDVKGLRQGEVVRYDQETDQLVRNSEGWLVKCRPGEVGVLVTEINEYNVFPGYLNDPETTEAKIIRNAFKDGDQYLFTEDLMQLHDNDYISFVDRMGDTYRWNGITVSANRVADVMIKFYGAVEDALVYGVQIPGLEGRCGMAALKLLEGEKLDWKGLVSHINRRMPPHARPVFIRITSEPDLGSAALKKRYRREGYDPMTVKDPLYFYDEKKTSYVRLTNELYQDVISGKVGI